jgi:glycosyltransferase involved in cell wall biosynthesis
MLAVSMARDEADIIAVTVGHLLAQGVDRVVVLDNGSADETPGLLAELGAEVIRDDRVDYQQARIMTDLASRADVGEWVVPFDADELWTGLTLLDSLDADVAIARPFVHVPHVDDVEDPNPCRRIVHRQPHPERLPKVAFRWRPGIVVDMGNHAVIGGSGRNAEPGLDVRHFQYRSLEQLSRKVRSGTAALDAARMPPTVGAHWRTLAALSDEALAAWWADYITQETVLDPAPCQAGVHA